MIFFLFASVFAESVVEIVNNDPASTWVAVDYHPSIIKHMKFLAMLGDNTEAPVDNTPYVEEANLPDNFDARKQWPGKLYAVRNQEQCGGCWAFAASEAIGDRLAIKGCGKGMLSPQDLISCDTQCSGCNGGTGPGSMSWIASKGLTTDACLPYKSGSGRVPACPTKCNNGSAITRFKITQAQTQTKASVQQDLYSNGPLYFRFDVYEDFMSYRSGVYQHRTGARKGGHAVLLVGWGVESGVPYWLLQNSWGPSWGEQGHFKIIRGKNECNCENGFYAGPVKC